MSSYCTMDLRFNQHLIFHMQVNGYTFQLCLTSVVTQKDVLDIKYMAWRNLIIPTKKCALHCDWLVQLHDVSQISHGNKQAAQHKQHSAWCLFPEVTTAYTVSPQRKLTVAGVWPVVLQPLPLLGFVIKCSKVLPIAELSSHSQLPSREGTWESLTQQLTT